MPLATAVRHRCVHARGTTFNSATLDTGAFRASLRHRARWSHLENHDNISNSPHSFGKPGDLAMTRLFLVRHGPTHAKSMVGWSDLPADLSDRAAIERLSGFLPPDALVISSDLSRAVATADAIQGTRQRLSHRAGLREINFGKWELRRFKDIETEDPEHIRAFWDRPGDIRAPDGESWNDVCQRVDREIDELTSAYRGRNLIVVAHFGAILTQVQRAEGLAAYDAFGHRIDNLSVTEISLHDEGWRTGRINHLP